MAIVDSVAAMGRAIVMFVCLFSAIGREGGEGKKERVGCYGGIRYKFQ